jgi:pimeloyl-ACP methyl ester carboxylesterase
MIDGISQTIIIRGHDTDKPLLLFLHGGPGMPEGGMIRKYTPDFEKMFLVVDWEQRGAGLTGSEPTPPESLTIEQLAKDTIELTRYLLKLFQREKALLFAHSFGTAIAIRALRQAPDLYAAYISSGQVVNQVRGEQLSYAYCLEQAEKKGNKKALEELRAVSFPEKGDYRSAKHPDTYSSIGIPRTWLGEFGGVTKDPKSLQSMLGSCVLTPEHSIFQALGIMDTFKKAMKTIWPQVMGYNFLATATRLEMAVYIVAGRADMDTPTSLVDEYFEALQAPRKEIFYFENSSHLAPWEEPAEMYKVMERVIAESE